MLPDAAPMSDWLSWLETCSPNEIELGLERVQVVLERLGLQRPGHLLLVAGTNGKGSCVAMLQALLLASGVSVGAYTSPHVLRYNERIAVNGTPATDLEIIAAFERVEAVRADVPLTYFEYGTLAAMVVFAAAEVQAWVLEVGMGGRLDATNVLDPTAVLITNVSLDHCDWLGDDIESIAVEKAGVMRKDMAVVFGAEQVPRAVLVRAAALGADLLVAGRDYAHAMNADGTWNWRGRTQSLQALQPPGLMGSFQIGNAAAVLSLLDVAGFTELLSVASVNAVLPALSLTGRAQRVMMHGTEWLLDVAHNPAAAAVLAETLQVNTVAGTTTAMIGMLDDKDATGFIVALRDQVERWIAVTADSPRAVPADELGRQIANLCDRSCLVADSLASAMQFARRDVAENDRILVTGSFFLVGPVLKQLGL
ncbi:MAG: bifunctional folylpolyglutamate synthase/dihydrofolate synthase [Proteobacteria bacterium]|nr:bifunctional folylpolyglutamate synthase/dihydrofolate synthase [Pseudomonadota bacterium]